MDKNTAKTLIKCPLFKGISQGNIFDILNSINTTIISFGKNQIVALEGDYCTRVGIILEGSLEFKKVYASGKTVTVTKMVKSHTFGEVMVFSDNNQYPSTINSVTDTKILFISKENILKLCRLNTQFLYNFMGLISNKVVLLNEKIKSLSYQSIRQKVAGFLLDEYNRQKKLTLTLSYSRREMAEHLGIPRPSLSREMRFMKDEGLIVYNKNRMEIINIRALENCLFN